MTDAIVKNLSFGEEARLKVFEGITKLTSAVSSTLGASGKCVMLEDNQGKPVITKDGVSVADSIVLLDPIENMGATLLKEAARKTVKEAGDGTTTATVLAHSILEQAYAVKPPANQRKLKNGIERATEKVTEYLKSIAIPVSGDMIDHVATISTNNDKELGKVIADAFRAVGETGVVMMESTGLTTTEIEIIDGVQYDKGLVNSHFITSKNKREASLENPLVLIVESPVETIRQIQAVLEHVMKTNRALLIIADIDQSVLSVLAMNKVKGNIKVNVINAPTYGVNKKDMLSDLALLTGSTVINEDLGDDMDLISPEHLGSCLKSVTTDVDTVLQVGDLKDDVVALINEIKKQLEDNISPGEVIRLEKRLARLSAKVAIVKVGANSEVELKEKADRVEDAICATKAAIKEGIVPGGGIALLNASNILKDTIESNEELVLLDAIRAPFLTILANAGIDELPSDFNMFKEGYGLDVITGDVVNMIDSGIIDPLLVTNSALKNASSVATTILSTDCVINNLRVNEGNR
jgi:chaperonin GroEL